MFPPSAIAGLIGLLSLLLALFIMWLTPDDEEKAETRQLSIIWGSFTVMILSLIVALTLTLAGH